jgi:hypothetical protein
MRVSIIGENTLPEQFWITLNSLQFLLIVYLAIILSKLRERIAKLEGKYEQRETNHKDDRD